MKVGIVADRLNRPLTGIGYYCYNLISELLKNNENCQIYLINYKKDTLFQNANNIILKSPFESVTNAYHIWHLYLQYLLNVKKLDLDLIHSPENASMFVRLNNQKKIVTVHDITPHLFPKSFTLVTSLRYKILFPRTLKSADKIIADSNSTKQDLIDYFKIPPQKIRVIYLAADKKFKPLSAEKINELKQQYQLNFPFILYVGTLEPRKNIPTLLRSFNEVKKKNVTHKLVIAGKKGWKYKEIFELIEQLKLNKEVIFTGYIPDEDLPALYNAADLFVYPSLYEGFGLPPLEAMACGTPVITSNTSSLPEVVGNAGIMVDPFDINALSNSIYEVLSTNELKEELIKNGLERARMFSWEMCARETIEVYEEVMSNVR